MQQPTNYKFPAATGQTMVIISASATENAEQGGLITDTVYCENANRRSAAGHGCRNQSS